MKILFLMLLAIGPLSAQMKTVTLHPLLTDMVKRVGGNRIEVIDLIGKTGDPHHFEPTAKRLQETTGARLYFVSGKGLESYLPSLQNIVTGDAKIVEVGKTLPSIEGRCNHEGHDHENSDEQHLHNLDPHWWHSIDLFRRATDIVAAELGAADPTHAAEFEKNAAQYRGELEELDRWVRKEIARIPRNDRKLATAHDAFAYFCKDYQFMAFPVQGVNREQSPDSLELATMIGELKRNHIVALFPEKESNPKILATLTTDTEILLAEPLIADGTNVNTYAEMVRHNIKAIVAALAMKP